ncbi:MAG: zinc ribbon domain-containing protein [Thermodesulfovibrionales bacterium]|nr:zinc ribbon domain-containing protein [Thermodesulfovibrionales bacterium]
MSGTFKCPDCGATTWGDLKHCPNCGHSLTVVCPVCGRIWRFTYEYKYCPNCGTKISLR